MYASTFALDRLKVMLVRFACGCNLYRGTILHLRWDLEQSVACILDASCTCMIHCCVNVCRHAHAPPPPRRRPSFRRPAGALQVCSLRVWLQSGTFTYAHAYIGTMRCSVATFLTFPQTSSRVRPRTRRPCPCRLHRWEQSARGTMRWPSQCCI